MKFLKFFIGLFLLISAFAPADVFAGDTVYYIFRHAEKVPDGETPKNPELTAEGHARAQYLSDMLFDEGVTRIFSTDYIRTRDTVAPLAERVGLKIELYDPRDLEGFAEQLKGMEGVIIISGHSNTTPELTAFLSGYETKPMFEDEYDRLYMVTFSEDGVRLNTIKMDVPAE